MDFRAPLQGHRHEGLSWRQAELPVESLMTARVTPWGRLRRPTALGAGQEGCMERVNVRVFAEDPLSEAGMLSSMRPRPEVTVVDGEDERVTVAVVVEDTVNDVTLQVLRGLHHGQCRALLVVRTVDDAASAAGVKAGLSGLFRRSEATPERLVHAVCAVVRGRHGPARLARPATGPGQARAAAGAESARIPSPTGITARRRGHGPAHGRGRVTSPRPDRQQRRT